MTTIEDATRAWANGIYPIEAGVELLIRQGKAIRENAPWILDLGSLGADRPRMASIDTTVLLDLAGAWSGGEQRIVRIAASLIDGIPVNLNEDLPGLDRTNVTLVLAAIAHANGSHEHSGMTFDETGRPMGFDQLPSLYPWPVEATVTETPSTTNAVRFIGPTPHSPNLAPDGPGPISR